MAEKRTFGWVQNPGDLKKLKKVVSVFLHGSSENQWLITERLPLLKKYDLISNDDYNTFILELSKSTIEAKYAILKGKGAGKLGRRKAKCTGIIQAVIDGQQSRDYTDSDGNTITIKKPYTDDWSADGYLRWAISCGLLIYNNKTDSCKISELGKELASAPNDTPEEKECLSKALLSYPPVIRILSLLNEKDKQTKFDLGAKLGFKGELGFTSIPQAIYLCDYCEANPVQQKEVKSNDEGDSDKYARGIASWLSQMGWVESSNIRVTDSYRGKTYSAIVQAFSITRAGEKALIRANGNSSNPRIPRIVMYEMLASNKAAGSDCLRYERACIIDTLSKGSKTLDQIHKSLKGYDIKIDVDTIKDHIIGLTTIGLDIEYKSDKYKLLDKINGLIIPNSDIIIKDDVNEIKNKVRAKLSALDHKYLILIDLAYSNASTVAKKNADAREFEIQTADMFTKELDCKGSRLGDSRKPDVCIYHDKNGLIIDNKSYKDGYEIPMGHADEIIRYIDENKQRKTSLNPNEWWNVFDDNVDKFNFAFISSRFKGTFKDRLDYISKRSGVNGAAISSVNLLLLAEEIKAGRMSYGDAFAKFECNDEIII